MYKPKTCQNRNKAIGEKTNMSGDSNLSGDNDERVGANEESTKVARNAGLTWVFLALVLGVIVFFVVISASPVATKFLAKQTVDPKTLQSIPGLTDNEVYGPLEEAGFKISQDGDRTICILERYRIEIFGKNVKVVRLTVVPDGDLGFFPQDREMAAFVGQLIYEDESMARITRGFASSRCSSTDTYDDGVTLMESKASDKKRVLTYRATGQEGELPD